MGKIEKTATKSAGDREKGDSYDIAGFASKFGLPPSEAATIIKRYGPTRRKLDAHMASRRA